MARGNTKPEYLLLLGKGMEISKGNFNNNLVPTIGFPASDNMLTSGLNGSNLEPGLATGRVPAKTNEEVENYLNKLKVYEQLPNENWRKKLLHISGGNSSSENTSFFNYQNLLFESARREFFGAGLVRVRKNVVNPVTDILTDKIMSETQLGTGLISYLGHGSSNTTEIILADLNKLNNENKPAIYLVNGCSTGAAFSTQSSSLSEQFILQKRSGAVLWIGTTSEGVASYLNGASLNYYNNWFKNSYGESVSKGLFRGLKTYQNPNDRLNVAHTRQYIVLGDPFLKFYSPDKPDYDIESIIISPGQTAANPNLNIQIIIKNLAKALNNKVTLKISRRLSDNSEVNLPDTSINIFNTDTINVNFNNTNIISSGNNRIMIQINPQRLVEETNYFNNTAIKDFFLPGNGLKIISPFNKSIVKNQTLKLQVQSENLLTNSAEYFFEIDTTPDFNSVFRKESGLISSSSIASWNPNINMENNKIYYWRTRLNLDPLRGGAWIYSSFTYVQDFQGEGYNIGHEGQLGDFTFDNINAVRPFLMSFNTSNMLTNIKTRGDDAPTNVEKRIRIDGLAISYASIEFNGITMLAFNPINYAERFQYPSPYNYINPPGSGFYAGPSGQYRYDIRNSTDLDSLVRYLNQIPKGHHIIGFNGSNAAFNLLPQYVLDEFRKLGLTKLETIKKGEPYGFWVTKGNLGSVKEITADYSSSIPPALQLISGDNPISYPGKNGSLSTGIIGPAKSWNKLEFNLENSINDNFNITVVGVDTLNNQINLFNSINNKIVDISQINAKNYPYLKFNYQFNNNVEAKLPKTNFLRVTYQPVSDISFYPELKNEQYKISLDEGDSIKWNIGLKNFGPVISDSLKVKYELISSNRTITKNFKLPFLLNVNETNNIIIHVPTIGFSGECLLKVSISQIGLKEENIFNNVISSNYTINKDKIPPVVNVTFDGKHIINGELVSPNPHIKIMSYDDNKFLLMRDTSLIELSIRNINDNNFKRIYFSGPQLSFSNLNGANQINIDYLPEKFVDGNYTLKITSKDVSGNKQLNNDFEIDFEVVNKQSITNFYPYPNPVSDKMKFVFTLTGDKIPENIKIQILTVSGRVIKEISKEELGSIRIGNNISDYTWDCTDDFGNRLANGVYFYKVDISDSSNIKHRESEGDKYFKNKMGKIYIIK
ncbi:C25 family cysteine peptidase [Pedobacter aquae]|uniref:C25 family cysteine peptidase n=1 Tax=Pedobacter aquae TaxID=2605747 RepID=UPI001F0A2F37|nr:C25 family cysteine peptidase [Pedobacter aquae]